MVKAWINTIATIYPCFFHGSMDCCYPCISMVKASMDTLKAWYNYPCFFHGSMDCSYSIYIFHAFMVKAWINQCDNHPWFFHGSMDSILHCGKFINRFSTNVLKSDIAFCIQFKEYTFQGGMV